MTIFDGRQTEGTMQNIQRKALGWIRWRTFRVCSVLLMALLCAAPIVAQIGGEGAIEGTVTDPSGAVIPKAKVIALNAKTGEIGRAHV